MKKRVFLVTLLTVFALMVSAQSMREINGKKIYYIHVLFEFEGKLKNTASIDYGYNSSMYARGKHADKIVDEKGEPLYFNSKLAMINYMTLQGWTYLNSTEEIFKDTYWSTFAKEITDEEANVILSKLTYKVEDKK